MTLSLASLPSRDEQLTVNEALAAVRIGRSTLYRHLANGHVPGIRFGRSWRLSTDTVRQLATNGLPNRSAVA